MIKPHDICSNTNCCKYNERRKNNCDFYSTNATRTDCQDFICDIEYNGPQTTNYHQNKYNIHSKEMISYTIEILQGATILATAKKYSLCTSSLGIAVKKLIEKKLNLKYKIIFNIQKHPNVEKYIARLKAL